MELIEYFVLLNDGSVAKTKALSKTKAISNIALHFGIDYDGVQQSINMIEWKDDKFRYLQMCGPNPEILKFDLKTKMKLPDYFNINLPKQPVEDLTTEFEDIL